MPVLRIDDRPYTLGPGQTRLGSGDGVDVGTGSDARTGVQAVIDVAGGQAVIRRTGSAPIRINGVALGAEPTPLMHGDRLEIDGRELLYADDGKSGATQFVSHAEMAALSPQRGGGARPTASTGGRLVSLVDGKEYAIPTRGVVIGRDAGADVVVAQNDVSRRHAEIVPAEGGYVIRDYSTNGVFVNGARVEGSRVLARADVVRIGGEEFRFHADVVSPAGRAAANGSAPARAAVAASAPAAAPASTPEPRPTPSAPAVLASLEVLNEGVTKGTRHDITVPLAHVGRGPHNDVVIDDDSVSESHAKLQRREDGWYVVDLGSTNGTYVGGVRMAGERRLEEGVPLRFGGVKMLFRPAQLPAAVLKETRPIANLGGERPARPRGVPASAAASVTAPSPASTAPSSSSYSWIWILALVAAGAAAFFLLKS